VDRYGGRKQQKEKKSVGGGKETKDSPGREKAKAQLRESKKKEGDN